MKNQKVSVVWVLILIVLVVVGGIYFYYKSPSVLPSAVSNMATTTSSGPISEAYYTLDYQFSYPTTPTKQQIIGATLTSQEGKVVSMPQSVWSIMNGPLSKGYVTGRAYVNPENPNEVFMSSVGDNLDPVRVYSYDMSTQKLTELYEKKIQLPDANIINIVGVSGTSIIFYWHDGGVDGPRPCSSPLAFPGLLALDSTTGVVSNFITPQSIVEKAQAKDAECEKNYVAP